MVKYLLILLFILIFPVPVFAQNDFDTKITIDYKYDEKGQSTVVQKINITYNNSQKYVSKYRLNIIGTKISNLSAYDSNGPLEVSENGEVKLNSVVAGKGNSTSFVVTYSGEKATNNGKIWEIDLPKIENWYQPAELTLNLIIPKKMGQMAYIFPNPSNTSLNYEKDFQLLTFSKERLADNKVVAGFGNIKSLDFDLKYHLNSPGLITLPSDDSYQRISLISIEPIPSNITIDSLGNWLASYSKIPDGFEIKVTGQAHIMSYPIRLPVEPTYENLQKYPDFKRKIFGYIPNSNELLVWNQHWDWGKHTWTFDNMIDSSPLTFGTKPNVLPNEVLLKFSEYSEKGFSPLQIVWKPPWQIFSLWSTKTSVEIRNPNGTAIYHLPVQFIENNLKLDLKNTAIPAIAPFGKAELNFKFLPNKGLNFENKSFTIFVGGQEITYNVERSLFLFYHASISFIIAIFVIFLSWIAVFTRRIYLQKHKG